MPPWKVLELTFLWFGLPRPLLTLVLRYRTQKPLNPGDSKKIRKKYKIPHPRLPPGNTKKLPKKIGHVCIFSVIFSYFRGANWGGGFCIFFRIFFVFQGFFGSVPPPRDRSSFVAAAVAAAMGWTIVVFIASTLDILSSCVVCLLRKQSSIQLLLKEFNKNILELRFRAPARETQIPWTHRPLNGPF